MPKYHVLFYSPVFVFAAFAAYAGAWPQKEGDLQTISTFSYYSTDYYYDTNGKRHSQETYSKYAGNLYAEYGWDGDWTFGLSLTPQLVVQNPSSLPTPPPGFIYYYRNYNIELADTELFVRYWTGNWGPVVFSTQPLIKLSTHRKFDALPQGGSSSYDAQLSEFAGYGFDAFGQHHYIDAALAYRHRFGDQGDQIRADATLGLSVWQDLQILTQVNGIFRTSDHQPMGFTQSSGDDFSLVKLQVSAVYSFSPNFSVQLGAFQHIYERNTGGGNGALLSVWEKF